MDTLLTAALALAVALLGLALWRERRALRRLARWVAQPRLTDPPEAEGAWGEVFDRLHRHRRNWLARRRELARLIVRSRRGAQALPYGVALLDARMRIDWCNRTACEHLGLDAARDRGQAVVNIVRDPAFVQYLERAEFSEPLRLRAPRDYARVLSLGVVAYGTAEYLLLSHDITAAERVEAMRRDFVANVSHELRTPVTVLAGFLETIQDLDLDAQRVRDYVKLMIPQAERMRRLIEDLLTLAELEHASAPPSVEPVPVRALLERVRAQAEALSRGQHRISVSFDGPETLVGAESELASAFVNLATNAVRYTPPGGDVRLIWRSREGGAEFVVEDTGIGIAPEHLPRLTERFYRVDRGRSRETGGTGLGLAIVKHVLVRHGATLEIESTPGKGSRFCARFPLAALPRSPQADAGGGAAREHSSWT